MTLCILKNDAKCLNQIQFLYKKIWLLILILKINFKGLMLIKKLIWYSALN